MKFSLTILGSSSAVPTASRNTTAHVLNVHERFFLIDCGEGTQIQIRRFRIRFGKINHIFITHLHSDHYLGIFGILSTMNIIGRKTELHLYAPKQLQELLNLHYSIVADKPDYPIVFHPLTEDARALVYEDESLEIRSFPMKHRIPAWGFLFREKSRGRNHGSLDLRSYAHCSDTTFDPGLAEIVGEADLLYHEATYLHEKVKRARSTWHSTAREAGEIARLAGVKLLVIGHFSARYKDVNPLLEEAKASFENTVDAYDGLTIEIN